MALECVATKRVSGFDQSKTEKYIARSVGSGQMRSDKMYAKVNRLCGVRRKVVDLVVGSLMDMMAEDIDGGKTVQMEEFGLSRPTTKTKGANTAEEVNASNILPKCIVFASRKIFHHTLGEINITRSMPVDTDYTDGSGNSGNTDGTDGSNEDGEGENPLG